jgi:hypothetical protein
MTIARRYNTADALESWDHVNAAQAIAPADPVLLPDLAGNANAVESMRKPIMHDRTMHR